MADEPKDGRGSQFWVVLIGAIFIGLNSLAATIIGALNHGKAETIESHQVTNSAKLDDTKTAVDAAKTAADTAKTTVAANTEKTDAKLDDIKKTMTALPPAVAQEVKKDK